MKEAIVELLKQYRKILPTWPFLSAYYLCLRALFGYSSTLLYILFLTIIVLRISPEYGVFAFFVPMIALYAFGELVEANHYISFIYVFLVIILLKQLYSLIKQRIHKE